MRNILIIGAGRSATSLIKYLLDKSETEKLALTIGDLSLENAQKLAGDHPNATAIKLDIFNEEERRKTVKEADLVISMLPARFHIEVAKDCLEFDKLLKIYKCFKAEIFLCIIYKGFILRKFTFAQQYF